LFFVLVFIYAAIICLEIIAGYQFIVRILKYTAIASCFVLAVLILEYSISHDDAKLLIGGLFFTLIADMFFLFTQAVVPGIICFYFAHLCYIRRYRRGSFKRNLVMVLAALLFCTVGFLSGLNFPYVFLLGSVYAVLIITATGLAFLSGLPKTNKRLAGIGMILFLLCDSNVAISFFAPKTGMLYGIADALIWIFYIPSQAMLSLSAADFERTQSSVQGQNQHSAAGKTGRQTNK
jgi:uncharacterized membrane protein YhhN